MNRFLSIILMVAFLSGAYLSIYGQQPEGSSFVQVSGVIPDSLKTNDRYAFLFIQFENQARFIDSCLIQNNRYLLKGDIPYNEIMSEIVIDGIPASSGGFILNSGDRVICDFEPLGRFARAKARGSSASEELFCILNDSINPHIARLSPLFKRLRVTDKNDLAYAGIQDSISHYQKKIIKIWYNLLQTTKSGFNAIYAFMNIASDLSPEEKRQAETAIIERFPDNINLSMVTGSSLKEDAFADPTIESMRTFNRYAILTGELPPYPDYMLKNDKGVDDQDNESQISISSSPQTADKDQITIIAPPPTQKKNILDKYGIGDRIEDFVLPTLQNQMFEFSQLDSEYILIDIWASWCAPCRKEVPFIKDAVRKYKSRLHVLAMSIDDNLYKWENAIKTDGTQEFTHVILRKDHPDQEKIRKLFDINTIPRNFLLDKNRRVIAINLQGKDLDKKLQELISKSSSEILVR